MLFSQPLNFSLSRSSCCITSLLLVNILIKKTQKTKTLRGTFIQSANNYLDELFYFGSLFVVKKKMQKKKTTITQIFNTIEAFNRAVMMQFYTAAFSKMYFWITSDPEGYLVQLFYCEGAQINNLHNFIRTINLSFYWLVSPCIRQPNSIKILPYVTRKSFKFLHPKEVFLCTI